MLLLIQQLYRMERDWDELNIREVERAPRRTTDFELTLQSLNQSTPLLMRRALPQSSPGKRCRHLVGQWDALIAHFDHSDTRIGTNLPENAIRPSAIGKKD